MDTILCVEVNEDIEIQKTRYYFRICEHLRYISCQIKIN